MSIALPQQARDLLDSTEVAVVSTLNADGSPQSSVVWVTRDGNDVLFNTARGRAKPKNIERDPRVSVLLYPTSNPYSYVEIRGTATVEDDPEAAMIHRLAHKYLGTDYPGLTPGEQRVTVRVAATKVVVHG